MLWLCVAAKGPGRPFCECIFIDTGAFLAIADKSDTAHAAATHALNEFMERKAVLCTSNYVIDETITLIRARVSHSAAVSFIKGFAVSGVEVLPVSDEIENRAKEIFIKYNDKYFSFTDCTSFAIIDNHAISAILSLDEHFSQYGYRRHVQHLLSPEKK